MLVAEPVTVRYRVAGMDCPSCATMVETTSRMVVGDWLSRSRRLRLPSRDSALCMRRTSPGEWVIGRDKVTK